MRIYIPSAGRAGSIGSVSTTLDSVTRATLVVPTSEVARYSSAVNRITENRSSQKREHDVVPCDEKGIAKTRRFIGEMAKARGEETFCMMDDDLYFSRRKRVDGYNLETIGWQEVPELVQWISQQLRDDVAHASVSIRGLNNTYPSGDVAALTQYNKRTLRVLAYQTEPFLKMRHGRVTVMEDFDVNLQLLRAGYRNATTFWWAQDQRGTGSAGGCSTYRTREAHDASAQRLAELHPEFVKLRTKKTKTSSKELQERLEVTIQWGQAYQSSQRRVA